MRCFFCIFILLLLKAPQVVAQQIPAYRVYDWSQAGSMINTGETATNEEIDFAEYQANFADADAAIANILETVTDGVSIYFPEGLYTFTRTVQLPDYVSIRGAGACETTLVFDVAEEGHAFAVSGSPGADSAYLTEAGIAQSRQITVENAESFVTGDWIKISLTDADLVTSDWAIGTVGQIVRIADIEENEVFLESELRMPFPLTAAPYIRKINPREGVHLSSFKIVRADADSGQTSNFRFDYAVNCTIENVESQFCNFAHVGIYNSAFLTVRDNYFHAAHNYGGGGKAYGTALQILTSECLIENNIFAELRHSMLLQAGANGNVLAYNYSTAPYWTGTSLPSDAAGDLVLHGNYVFANLAEGNTVRNIVIDDSHGNNGPHNTFLRNRAEGYGMVMNSGTPTDSVNFVGNEVTGFTGLWWLAGEGHFQYGNSIWGGFITEDSPTEFVNSLFTATAPAYFSQNNLSLPAVGFPLVPSQNVLPAEVRYNDGYYMIDCQPETPIDTVDTETPVDTTVTTAVYNFAQNDIFSVYPNPTDGHLFWKTESSRPIKGTVTLYDARGGRVAERVVWGESGEMNLYRLPSGIYTVELREENGKRMRRRLVKQ